MASNTIRSQSIKGLVVVLLIFVAIGMVGCLAKSGPYAPVDWAAEMHYTQAYRSQEPPTVPGVPGAVPVTGGEVTLTNEEYLRMESPIADSPVDSVDAVELFRTNCSMCHGVSADGTGRVSEYLKRYGYVAAPDLTAEATIAKTDGQLFGIITQGVVVMPSFRNLLSSEDRWLVVSHIRSLQDK